MKKAFSMILVLVLVLGMVGCSAGQGSQKYPSKNIEFVVPFAAGGSADQFARSFADLLAVETGVTVTVNNKEGAGGVTGLTYAGEQDADGYTICLVTPSMPIAEVKGKIDFQNDWIPIACMEQDIYVISVLDSNKKFTDWEGLLAYAKANPNDVTTGGSGAGGLDEFVAAQFAEAAGIEITYVPYGGYGEYKTAFLGGEVDLYIDKLSSYTGMAQYSQILPMAVTNDAKVATAGLDNVPTLKDLGVDFTAGSWRGIVVKKGTPDAIVEQLRTLCETIYKSDEFQAVLAKDSADVVYGYKNGADFTAFIASEVERYDAVINSK
ncbi:MAG: Bug family tripartite tricarboxylate transporter substrate binding protein [Faecousia sp.]